MLEDGDVRIGVFPNRKEILITGAGFSGVVLQSVGTGEAEMSKRADGFVKDNAAMADDFLKLSGCFASSAQQNRVGEVSVPASFRRVLTAPTLSVAYSLAALIGQVTTHHSE